jgi:hypothetical protein
MGPARVSNGRHPVQVELTQAVRDQQGCTSGREAHVTDGDACSWLAVAISS